MSKQNVYSELLAHIENADDLQINQVMDAVERRYRAAFPDWEVVYVAVHKEPKQRRKDIDSIIDLLSRT